MLFVLGVGHVGFLVVWLLGDFVFVCYDFGGLSWLLLVFGRYVRDCCF